jgi:hypothetical protein
MSPLQKCAYQILACCTAASAHPAATAGLSFRSGRVRLDWLIAGITRRGINVSETENLVYIRKADHRPLARTAQAATLAISN